MLNPPLARICAALIAAHLVAMPLTEPIAAADDLTALVKEYREARAVVGGSPGARARKANEVVAPVIERIGELGSDEALAFLVKEVDEAVPEVGALCAATVVKSGHPRARLVVLRGFARRHEAVQSGILTALAEKDVSLRGLESELVRTARTVRDPEIKALVPPVLARLDRVDAASVMLEGVTAARSGARGEGPQEAAYADAVVAALAETKNEKVRAWLEAGAFKAARNNAARLEALARVAGILELQGARDELERLLTHRSPSLAAAALEALAQLGLSKSVDRIARALEAYKGQDDLEYRIRALDAIAATGSEEAVELIAKYTRGRDADMRAVAMGSLGLAAGLPSAVDLLIRGLGDRERHVRAAALRALGEARDKRVIGALIEFMDAEEEYRLKVDALKLLVKLTDKNMGLVAADWKNWWELAGADFQFAEKETEGSTRVETYDLSYFGIEVSSRRLSFVVDISSSMRRRVTVQSKKGEKSVPKIEVLKSELASTIEKLPADAQINILTFDATYRAWQKKLQPLAGSGRARAVSFVKNISTGSGTNVFDTLEHALQDERVNTIYLLTDGQPTRGRITDPKAIVREVRVLNRLRSVTIHCIAFGEESELLKRLAAQNGGEYRFVSKV